MSVVTVPQVGVRLWELSQADLIAGSKGTLGARRTQSSLFITLPVHSAFISTDNLSAALKPCFVKSC